MDSEAIQKRLREAVEATERGEPQAISLEYVHLVRTCGECGDEAVVIRVTQIANGELAIRTLCKAHAEAESREAVERHGFVALEPGSRFVNANLFGEPPDSMRCAPFYLHDVAPD